MPVPSGERVCVQVYGNCARVHKRVRECMNEQGSGNEGGVEEREGGKVGRKAGEGGGRFAGTHLRFAPMGVSVSGFENRSIALGCRLTVLISTAPVQVVVIIHAGANPIGICQ